MNRNRSIVQILIIIIATLAFSLIGVILIVSEVRAEILRFLLEAINSTALPTALHIPPNVWRGFLLIAFLAAIYLILRAITLKQIPRLSKAHICPRCAGHLQRIYRHPSERIMALVLLSNIFRYGCSSCEWTGLRRHRRKHQT